MAGSEPKRPIPRLLMVGGDGHPSGVPRNIRHLAAVLSDRADITVASDENHGGYDGLKAVHITVPGLRSSLSPRRLWTGWRGLRALLHQRDWGVIWLHARLPVVFGRVMLALRLWRPKGRVAITYHGLPFGPGHRPGFRQLSSLLERALLRFCPPLDLVFLSQGQADRMAQGVGAGAMRRHRVHVLPNSSDLGAVTLVNQPGRRHLVMTGRCGWQKNYPLALRLFAQLPGSYTLTLCGSGTDSAAFQAEAAQVLPPEALTRVRFAGPLGDVRPALAEADAYLLTSRYEGQPIGTIEAFEAGLPLILGRFDGAEEIIEGHPAALLLGLEDLGADAARITAFLDQCAGQDLPPQIRAAWAERWSYDVFATRARAVFAALADKG